MPDAPLCGLTATAMTALVDAVRAGDIEAAQALLPVDPIVKRAREICARHMGTPATYIAGKMDGWPAMGAVTEALRTTHSTLTAVTDDQLTRMARTACYTFATHDARLGGGGWRTNDFLSGACDGSSVLVSVKDAIGSALRA